MKYTHMKSAITLLLVLSVIIVLQNSTSSSVNSSSEMSDAFVLVESIINDNTIEYSVQRVNGSSVTYCEALGMYAGEDESFIDLVTSAIQTSSFPALYFEHPGMTYELCETAEYKFALTRSKSLEDINPNGATFANTDAAATLDSIIITTNLGKDAVLVIPNPLVFTESDFSSVARFMRNADSITIRTFFETAGRTMLEQLGERDGEPIWLSTAGDGVSWLHLRMDSLPKYYHYQPYKSV